MHYFVAQVKFRGTDHMTGREVETLVDYSAPGISIVDGTLFLLDHSLATVNLGELDWADRCLAIYAPGEWLSVSRVDGLWEQPA